MPALPQVVNQQTISYQNIRVGMGNPNDIGQYGEKGWIYQDWDGGKLWIATSDGTGIWAPSGDGGQPSNPLVDGSGFSSVDFYNRFLLTSADPNEGSNASINWENRQLFNSEANPTLNWNSSILTDSNGLYLTSIDWSTRYLYDVDGVQCANYGESILNDASLIASVAWGGRVLVDQNNYTTVSWNTGELSSSEIVRVNWFNGVLSDIDGFPMLNWETGEVSDTLHDPTLNWTYRYLYKQWTTNGSGKMAGNVMSNTPYTSMTSTGGTYNPVAPANAGMVIYHASSALIASMTLQLHGASSALDSVPVGGDISFTSRYGVTALTVTYGSAYTLLGTAVTTCAAGATITWRKLSSTLIARLT